MIDKEELFLVLAVILLAISALCYVAIGDALKEIRRRISQFVFRPSIGIAPPPPPAKRKTGLRRIK